MDKGLKKILLFITGGLFLMLGIIIIPFTITDSKSRNWPTTTAEIKKCEVKGKHLEADDPLYLLDVEYEYKVGDQIYNSTNYGTYDRLSSKSEGQMVDMKKNYPVGSKIIIAYDPNQPGYALMNPGIVWYHMIGLAIVSFFWVCFLTCVLLKGKAQKPIVFIKE